MTIYRSINASATLRQDARRVREDDVDRIIDGFADYHVVVSTSLTGEVEVVVSLPAESLAQAIRTAQALFAPLRPIGLEVIPSELFDRRAGLPFTPEWFSVTEAAQGLGVTRQAVLQRVASGSLPAVKIGTSWAIPAAAVHQLAGELAGPQASE